VKRSITIGNGNIFDKLVCQALKCEHVSSSALWLALVAGSAENTLPTGRACLPPSSQQGASVPRVWPALDRRGRSATTSTFRLSPTTDHATNATSRYWWPFIPCNGDTSMERSSC